jgi:proteasome assembly chaperone (PAC2) family protein
VEEVVYLEMPILQRPCLIAGFEGWPNAAEVSSFAIQHLVGSLEAKKFASIPSETFCQFSTSRPVATIRDGKLMDLKSAGNTFYYSKTSSGQDLILFHGVEPHLRWNAFVDLVLDLSERLGVSQIYTLGGTYDYIPHTLPPVVSALISHDDLREKVIQAGLRLTEYNGPISIHTLILAGARKKGIRTISLWGHAPQYLQTKNVKVALSILKGLVFLTGVEVDLSELERSSEYFNHQVTQLVEQDPKLQEIIGKLEEAYRKSEESSQSSKREEGWKDEKVVYIQAFLKRQEDEEKKEG